MSTDFCMATLLSKSTSNSSVTPELSSKQTTPTTQSQTAPVASPVEVKEPSKKRGTKRKRDDEGASSKKKRVRTAYTQAQLHHLETMFRQTQYPDMLTRQSIAEQLGVEEKKIHVWFQNRRAKHRKHGGSASPCVLPMPSPLMFQQHQLLGLPPPSINSPLTSTSPANLSPASPLPVYLPLRAVPGCPVSSSISPFPQQQYSPTIHNPFDFHNLIASTVPQTSSPQHLSSPAVSPVSSITSHHPIPQQISSHSVQTSPVPRPSTVHLIRRSRSPQSNGSVSPQHSSPTLSTFLTSPQLNVSPVQKVTPNGTAVYSFVLPHTSIINS